MTYAEEIKKQLIEEWKLMYKRIVDLVNEGKTASEIIKSRGVRHIDKKDPKNMERRPKFTNTTNFKSYLFEMCVELNEVPPKIPTKKRKRSFMLQQIEGRDRGVRKVCLLPQMVFDHLGMGDFDEENIRTEDRKSKQNYYIKMEMKKTSKKVFVELTKATEDDVNKYEEITDKELF